MSQPYDPHNPYRGLGDPAVYEPQPAQAPYGYGQQPAQHDPYGYAQQPPPPSPKSNLPIFLAAGLVVVLAIGVTLFLVLRPEGTSAGGGGGAPGKPSAVDVTKAFFEAVDARDEDAMKANARGSVLDDIDDIMDEPDIGFMFATGELLDDASQEVDGVQIAIVIWDVVDLPKDVPDGESTLVVGLLDEGEGFDVCHIDDPADEGISSLMTSWETQYEESCDYKA